MNKTILINCLLYIVTVNSIIYGEESKAESEMSEERGYFFGYSFGGILLRTGNIDVDLREVNEGLIDALSGQPHRMDQAERQVVVEAIQKLEAIQLAENEAALGMQADTNRVTAEEFLEQNKSKQGVRTTDSGLQYEVIEAGKGPKPKATDKVTVHYTGTFLDGTEFDSTATRGTPASFSVTGVIAGWTEALQLMQIGAKYRLYIHPDLGYGEKGRASIPPNSLLIFDVELLAIK
jgi:FKBP-type peptidyl-prolyl cis-trans isomerase FkpA